MIANESDRFDRVVISNSGLPYNPDLPESVVKEVEDFRANAPTPSLVQMQRSIGPHGQERQCGAGIRALAEMVLGNERPADRFPHVDDD